MDFLRTALFSILIPVGASVATTIVLNSKFYFTFHRGKLVEDLILRGDVQVRSNTISSPSDWEAVNYQSCYYFCISKDSSVKILNPNEYSEIDVYSKYKYIHIQNNSSLYILISEIRLKNGSFRNLYDWGSAEIAPGESRDLIIDSYDDITKITIDYNGRNVQYEITDKKGYAPCKIQKKKRKKKKLKDITIIGEEKSY